MERQQKQLDCLLADYTAIKAEIVRRSNLQRVVIATYVLVAAIIFWKFSQNEGNVFIVFGAFVSSTTSLLMYVREHLKIMRLGFIIKCRIAPVISTILNVDCQSIFPSETNESYIATEKTRSRFENIFNAIVFFGVPCILTIKYVCEYDCLADIMAYKVTVFYLVLMPVLLIGIILLLFIRARS